VEQMSTNSSDRPSVEMGRLPTKVPTRKKMELCGRTRLLSSKSNVRPQAPKSTRIFLLCLKSISKQAGRVCTTSWAWGTHQRVAERVPILVKEVLLPGLLRFLALVVHRDSCIPFHPPVAALRSLVFPAFTMVSDVVVSLTTSVYRHGGRRAHGSVIPRRIDPSGALNCAEFLGGGDVDGTFQMMHVEQPVRGAGSRVDASHGTKGGSS
jgi:hypothetical protein